MTTADPRPARRIVDARATLRACLRYRECGVCGAPSATGHHVFARGQRGDDVVENIVPLCGSGTTGCHGRVENGDAEALRLLGEWIVERRPDVVAYLRTKLGDGADAWIERTFRGVSA